MKPTKKMMLTFIMLLSVVLWGSFMMGWFEGVEIYFLPGLIILWLFFIVKWSQQPRK